MSYKVSRASLGPRVRGLRVKLLPLELIYSLAHSKNLEEFTNGLRSLGIHVPERLDAINVRRGIKRAYLSRLIQLYSSTTGNARDVVLRHLIHWEYDNVKIIARGLALGVDVSRIEGELDLEVEEVLRRRHILAFLLSSRDLGELRERARRVRHPVHTALDAYVKLGVSDIGLMETLVELSYFNDILEEAKRLKDRGLNYVIDSLMKYIAIRLAVRLKVWEYPQEVLKELIPKNFLGYALNAYAQQPQQLVQYIAGVLPESEGLGKFVPEPTLRGISVALDNMFPTILRRIADGCIIKYSEFSLGSLYAHLELVKGEAGLLSVLGSLIAEGVEVLKRLEAVGYRAG